MTRTLFNFGVALNLPVYEVSMKIHQKYNSKITYDEVPSLLVCSCTISPCKESPVQFMVHGYVHGYGHGYGYLVLWLW